MAQCQDSSLDTPVPSTFFLSFFSFPSSVFFLALAGKLAHVFSLVGFQTPPPKNDGRGAGYGKT